MVRNQAGSLCADAAKTAERIKQASDDEVEAMAERQAILRDVLNSFDMRLKDLPERDRKAALSLLYKRITCIVFDFHLALETSASCVKIVNATKHGEKVEALHEFRLQVEDLMMLYGIT
ncbi:MAG: hypothetical protein NTY53_08555 [Kiritimatiellaeota bacterium]|nr:hypothetical protein [Kiritimatiellota bacterium]